MARLNKLYSPALLTLVLVGCGGGDQNNAAASVDKTSCVVVQGSQVSSTLGGTSITNWMYTVKNACREAVAVAFCQDDPVIIADITGPPSYLAELQCRNSYVLHSVGGVISPTQTNVSGRSQVTINAFSMLSSDLPTYSSLLDRVGKSSIKYVALDLGSDCIASANFDPFTRKWRIDGC